MLNAAMIGLGWWGRHMVRAMQGSEHLRFVRLAAGHPDRHRGFAEETGIALLPDFDAVLADPQVDAVVLCTPHSQHEQQVLAALAAGKQVFCEKPLALTRAAAERMTEAAQKAGRTLGIGHERRFQPSMEAIAQRITAGELGVALHAEANWSHDLLGDVDRDNWRLSPAEGPSVSMTGMGLHLTDLLIWMLGPVAKVCATRADRVMGLPTGDVVAVALRFRSGATGFVSATVATPYYCRFTVLGDRLWIEARETGHPQHGGETILTLCRKGGKPETHPLSPRDPARANLEEWARAVEGRGRYRFTPAEMVNNTAVLEAVGLSAQRGEWVEV